MYRRTFLGSTASTAFAGSALLGFGAFTRAESQRDLTIEVAEDPSAYLGFDGTTSSNSENYVEIDENGHLTITIDGETNEYGDGVNSRSSTWFDSMFEVCNQGKEDVGFWIVPPEDDDFPDGIGAEDANGTQRVQFYTGDAAGDGTDGIDSVMGMDNAVAIGVGECIDLGVRVVTNEIDATSEKPLFGNEITLIPDVSVEGKSSVEEPSGLELPVNADPNEELEDQFELLTTTTFGTDAVEVCLEHERLDGETTIGVQVTDHQGTFDEGPTTWNPGSTFLASATIEFEDGSGCFTIGNPGVERVTFMLFPFGAGLLRVDHIENIAVAIDGEEPDEMFIRGVDATKKVDGEISETATVSTAVSANGFDDYEADR